MYEGTSQEQFDSRRELGELWTLRHMFPFSGCGINLPLLSTHILISVAQAAVCEITVVRGDCKDEKVKKKNV